MSIIWNQVELDKHNAAWKAAKVEILGSAEADIPMLWFSVVVRRADVIHSQMKERKND